MCLAVPGKVVEIIEAEGLVRRGKVDFAGILKEVDLVFVPEAGVGDYVMVHVGFAISRVDEAEAARIFDLLGELP